MKNLAVYQNKSKEVYLTQDFNSKHLAIDLSQGFGSVITSIASGTIAKAGYFGGYGNFVEVQHSNGYTSRYGHLSKIQVITGQKVKKGQAIGIEGSTGLSTGSHLHFEILKNGININPLEYATGKKEIDSFFTRNLIITIIILTILYLFLYEK